MSVSQESTENLSGGVTGAGSARALLPSVLVGLAWTLRHRFRDGSMLVLLVAVIATLASVGLPGLVRISFGCYNNLEEVDHTVDIVARIACGLYFFGNVFNTFDATDRCDTEFLYQ